MTDVALPRQYTQAISSFGIPYSPVIPLPSGPVLQPSRGFGQNSSVGKTSTAVDDSPNFLGYIQDIPDQIRSSLAEFFSTGKADALNITEDHFHHFFHTGRLIHHHSAIIKHCIKFFQRCNNKLRVLQTMQVCTCDCSAALHEEVHNFSKDRSQKEAERGIPEYAILFLAKSETDKKQKVVSVDVSTRLHRYTCDIDKVNKFGTGFAVCSVDIKESPYVVLSGGAGKNEKLINLYDVVLGKWEKGLKLNRGRQFHMMAAVNDEVFIFGGLGTPSVERFDPNVRFCDEICTLKISVHSAAYAVHGSKIYIFGGKDKTGEDVSTVQCIDTERKSTHVLDDFPCTCSGGQAVVRGNDIFIASNQGHMIRFNVHVGKSELCEPQLSNRKQFVLFVRRGSIFLMGGVKCGFRGDGGAENVLCRYCPEKDKWSVYHTLKTPLHVYTSCLVRYSRKCPIIPFCP